jgi:hypothetical protein
VFVGTRVPLATLLDYLEAGQPLSEFLEDFPTVTKEQAVVALEQAKAHGIHSQVSRSAAGRKRIRQGSPTTYLGPSKERRTSSTARLAEPSSSFP